MSANAYPAFKMRLDAERRAAFERAAADAGRSLAAWFKELGDRELARLELGVSAMITDPVFGQAPGETYDEVKDRVKVTLLERDARLTGTGFVFLEGRKRPIRIADDGTITLADEE